MGCDNPSHHHVWNTTGNLIIARCETTCDFCLENRNIVKRFPFAWFVRRHVNGVHVGKTHPDLRCEEAWDEKRKKVLEARKKEKNSAENQANISQNHDRPRAPGSGNSRRARKLRYRSRSQSHSESGDDGEHVLPSESEEKQTNQVTTDILSQFLVEPLPFALDAETFSAGYGVNPGNTPHNQTKAYPPLASVLVNHPAKEYEYEDFTTRHSQTWLSDHPYPPSLDLGLDRDTPGSYQEDSHDIMNLGPEIDTSHWPSDLGLLDMFRVDLFGFSDEHTGEKAFRSGLEKIDEALSSKPGQDDGGAADDTLIAASQEHELGFGSGYGEDKQSGHSDDLSESRTRGVGVSVYDEHHAEHEPATELESHHTDGTVEDGVPAHTIDAKKGASVAAWPLAGDLSNTKFKGRCGAEGLDSKPGVTGSSPTSGQPAADTAAPLASYVPPSSTGLHVRTLATISRLHAAACKHGLNSANFFYYLTQYFESGVRRQEGAREAARITKAKTERKQAERQTHMAEVERVAATAQANWKAWVEERALKYNDGA